LGLLAGGVWAETGHEGTRLEDEVMRLRDELLRLEEGFWKATGDPDYYREHMADDGLAVFSEGVMGKDAAVASTTAPGSEGWSEIRVEEPRVIELADNAVALVYRGTARRNGEPYAANCTTVYARRDGEWKLALHQQSKLSAAPVGAG
jgi:ketosteroid isomerase-like protein